MSKDAFPRDVLSLSRGILSLSKDVFPRDILSLSRSILSLSKDALSPGERHRKTAAFAQLAFYTHTAAVHFGQFFHQRQPQPGPFIRARQAAVHLAKRLEQAADVFGRNANPRVGHYKMHQGARRIGGYLQMHLSSG